ncbi:class I SAM-dependent methyltransferase [Rossellomorea aquimaris]|uniref:class I SAM-dependent methyltransferase n=1 Tax=Rossellomorea aquimaris TaxID=189382 RepID=UPI001CD3C09F|nr:class I SAM-dependent methyltransferase [Rossellomorea aquimaris]MCA1055329.1 class I SAM-dependent methyltransferase [Rossellomorea aquimaris]
MNQATVPSGMPDTTTTLLEGPSMEGHGHLFEHHKAAKLLDPKRQELVPVDKVLHLLQLQQDDLVADLGCGNGYLTLPIAKSVDTKVHAVDLQQEMLEYLEHRAKEEHITNIVYEKASLEYLSFNKSTLDKVVSAFVLHEVPNLTKVFQDLNDMLKDDGLWLILDWEAVESEMGPPLHERIASEDLAQQLDTAGFKTETGHLHPSVYYIAVRKG